MYQKKSHPVLMQEVELGHSPQVTKPPLDQPLGDSPSQPILRYSFLAPIIRPVRSEARI